MADGTRQTDFRWPSRRSNSQLRPGEIMVDFFAGGGGASEALRQALGRDPDVAVNHDADAISMHAANHPFTRHMNADVWEVDILREVAGRRVGWFHASPDCTHFSQAKGGQPRSRATRSLSWVVIKIAGTLARHGLAPRIISLENVRQILQWGPLVAKRDKATGRVVTLDTITDPATGKTTYRIAELGERVPLERQHLVPDKRRAGRTWRQFVRALQALGYVVEHRRLVACDYGAGTSRDRLFMVARRDGEAIRWPEPTHGPGRAHPYVTAADCIDWSIPCPSIFTRKRPLAEATCRRIAKGIRRYVLDAADPFIVQCANASANGVADGRDPLGTITAKPRGGTHAVVAPTLVQAAHGDGRPGGPKRWGTGARDVQQTLGTVTASGGHAIAAATLVQTGYGERAGQAPRVPGLHKPLGTIVAGASKHAEVTAFLEQANTGVIGHDAREPVSTIVGKGCTQRLIAAHLAKLRGTSSAADAADPLATISAGGEHHAAVECTLSPEAEAGALQVAAFLMRYHSTGGQHRDLREPMTAITTKDRLALVTVVIHGTPYVIVDIGLRMLSPPELYRAQGFPDGYIIDRTADGRRLSKSAAVKMVGNSVSPPPLCAIARANLDATHKMEAAAA